LATNSTTRAHSGLSPSVGRPRASTPFGPVHDRFLVRQPFVSFGTPQRPAVVASWRWQCRYPSRELPVASSSPDLSIDGPPWDQRCTAGDRRDVCSSWSCPASLPGSVSQTLVLPNGGCPLFYWDPVCSGSLFRKRVDPICQRNRKAQCSL